MAISSDLVETWLNFLLANAVNNALTLGLGDDLGGEVIHVSSAIPQALNLSIANKLTDEILIVGQPGPASSSNYHFCIQFANNQCFLPPPPLTVTTPGWLMSAPVKQEGDFIKNIYLLSTETITLKAASAAGESSTKVGLQYIEATLASAGVDVLTVFVSVGQNVIAKLTPNDQPVSGTETLHLGTFTDASAPTPLIATLVQPKTILDDGTERDLLLRLVNTSPDPVPFLRPPQPGGLTPTAIELSIDLDPAAAWALCKKDEADLIHVTPPTNWSGDGGHVGTRQKTWIFHPKYDATTRIDPNSALEFPISGVKTTLPPGFANLYVTLREFPNYGTQSLVTQIEKSPLIYNDGLNSGLLTQGTAGANHGLAINGTTSVALLRVDQLGAGLCARFKGAGGVKIDDDLDVGGDVRLNDRTLWLRTGEDKNNGIGWHGKDKPFAKQSVDGPVVFGHEGGALASTNNGERIALSWDDTGKVGIGAKAKSTLSVSGGVAVGATYADTHVAPASGLLVEGSVGIGTTNPSSTLSVKGGMTVGPTYANSVASPDGLFVEGAVAIGTKQPECQFQVRSNNSIRLGLEGNGGGQLVIGNTQNDNTVQLVASGLNSTPQKHESAALLYLGGWADAQLPKMRLNATEIDLEGTTNVSGKVSAEGLALTGKLTITGNQDANNVIQLGYGAKDRQEDAGKIAYRVFSDGLDIVGASSSIGTRQVHLWDDVYIHGNFWMLYKHGDGSGPFWCQMSTKQGYVNDQNWDYAVFNNLSDARLKTNVTPIESPLERLRKLHGCNYDWNEDAFTLFTKGIDTICSADPDASAEKTEALRQSEREKRKKNLARPQVGVIAQDVEAVLPEAVTTDEEGYKSVHYHQLIPLLIEAIKEQDLAVTAQAELLARQQREIERLTRDIDRLMQVVAVSV